MNKLASAHTTNGCVKQCIAFSHHALHTLHSRNIEKEQKKARDRYHARQAQKKAAEEAVMSDLARRVSLMPRTAKVRHVAPEHCAALII